MKLKISIVLQNFFDWHRWFFVLLTIPPVSCIIPVDYRTSFLVMIWIEFYDRGWDEWRTVLYMFLWTKHVKCHLSMATFFRTFPHDSKIRPAWWGWGYTPSPFPFSYHHEQSCGVRSSWEGRYTPSISPLPLYVLCGCAITEVKKTRGATLICWNGCDRMCKRHSVRAAL